MVLLLLSTLSLLRLCYVVVVGCGEGGIACCAGVVGAVDGDGVVVVVVGVVSVGDDYVVYGVVSAVVGCGVVGVAAMVCCNIRGGVAVDVVRAVRVVNAIVVIRSSITAGVYVRCIIAAVVVGVVMYGVGVGSSIVVVVVGGCTVGGVAVDDGVTT